MLSSVPLFFLSPFFNLWKKYLLELSNNFEDNALVEFLENKLGLTCQGSCPCEYPPG